MKHGLGYFEIKMLKICMRSQERFALYTLLQWNTEKYTLFSDLEGNELNGKKMKYVGDPTDDFTSFTNDSYD